MSCARHWLHSALLPLAAMAFPSCTGLRLGTQGSGIEFRSPSIAVAYPANGGVLPADKPLVVLRFGRGQRDDPIDPAAFRATVDGVDHTARFHVTDSEAWGQLGDSSGAPGLTPGAHVVHARVCSARGACAVVTARVEVRPWERLLDSLPYAGSAARRLPNDLRSLSRAPGTGGRTALLSLSIHTGV